jgi:hypothetical protein
MALLGETDFAECYEDRFSQTRCSLYLYIEHLIATPAL